MEQNGLTTDDILSELKFVYICLGIVLPVIIGFGLIGNALALCALCHKALKSAPVCLLQALTVNDIFNLVYSIYSDVEPSITSYNAAKKFVQFLNNFRRERKEQIKVDINGNTSFLFQQILSVYGRIKQCNFTMENGGYKISRTSRTSTCNSTFSQFGNSLSGCQSCNSYLAETTTPSVTETLPFPQKDIDKFILKGLEFFIAYTIIHFGLLITLSLATERCVAVWLPLRASRILTIRRTRLTIVFLFFLNCFVHLTQLIKDVVLVKEDPTQLLKHKSEYTSLAHRRDYERFYAISSIVMCILLFIMNSALLYKLLVFRKRLDFCRHIKNAQRQEINITLVIVILLFFQLPVYIFINVIAFMKREQFETDLSTMTRLTVVFRLIYVSQSALNFIIYCFFAKNIRNVFKQTYVKIIEAVSINAELKITVTNLGHGTSISRKSSERARANSFNHLNKMKDLDVMPLKDLPLVRGDTV